MSAARKGASGRAGAGPKGAGGKKGEEEQAAACPDWVFGLKTVLDPAWAQPTEPLVDPPFGQYLDEVLLGIVGGAGDAAAKDVRPSPRNPGGTVSALHRAEALAHILAMEHTRHICRSTFWLVLAGAFGQVRATVARRFREQLGKGWFAITLHCMTTYADDRDMQDAVLWSLPFLIAQSIYRLLVDGFIEDRKRFINDAEAMVLKASQIAHFEVTGFQVSPEVVRKSRNRLFLKRVVKSPHIDQRELMKGRKRQEILECHTANAALQPLSFGDPSGSLEETQLDHVLHGSEARRQAELKLLAAGKQAWELAATPVPEHLCVQRHMPLEQFGKALRRAQTKRLTSIVGYVSDGAASSDGEDDDDGTATPSDGGSPGPTPLSATSPLPGRRMSQQWASEADGGPSDDDISPRLGSTTPSAKRLWRKGMVIAKLQAAKDDYRTRREREAKALKLRQETLERKIGREPLPAGLSERAFTTTWVSPAIASLAGEPDREVLHKTSAEAFTVKMEVRPHMLSPTQSKPRSASMPLLRPSSKAGGTPTAAKPPGGGEDPVGSPSSAIRGVPSPDWRRQTSSPAWLPRVTVGSRRITVAMPVDSVQTGERIALHPPERLGPGIVEQRVEADAQGFQKLSFAIYRQEHDVLTGVKKFSKDGRKLREEEEDYIKHMRSMVSGRPKTLISPGSLLRRHDGPAA